MDAITLRGLERLLIVVGAIFFGYLGYLLFVKGIAKGEGNLKFESKVMKIIFSGTGPGLFFMAFGATALVTSILYGGATVKDSTLQELQSIRSSTNATEQLKNLQDKIGALELKNVSLENIIREQSLRVKSTPRRSTTPILSAETPPANKEANQTSVAGNPAGQIQAPVIQHERVEILKK